MLSSLCFMRLNTAGVVIGWLGIILSFVITILISIILGHADVIANRIAVSMGASYETYKEIESVLVIICGVNLAVVIIKLISSAMLVLGTMKRNHLMLLPWLFNNAVSLFIDILFTLIAWGIILHKEGPFTPMSIPLIFMILGLALNLYIFRGIYSLFKRIQVTRDQQHPLISGNASDCNETIPYAHI